MLKQTPSFARLAVRVRRDLIGPFALLRAPCAVRVLVLERHGATHAVRPDCLPPAVHVPALPLRASAARSLAAVLAAFATGWSDSLRAAGLRLRFCFVAAAAPGSCLTFQTRCQPLTNQICFNML